MPSWLSMPGIMISFPVSTPNTASFATSSALIALTRNRTPARSLNLVHRAGAEQADGHTAMLVAQLLSDGERKTHHIVFGGVVAGEQRTGEKSGAGCHVEDSAAATLLEVPEKQLG